MPPSPPVPPTRCHSYGRQWMRDTCWESPSLTYLLHPSISPSSLLPLLPLPLFPLSPLSHPKMIFEGICYALSVRVRLRLSISPDEPETKSHLSLSLSSEPALSQQILNACIFATAKTGREPRSRMMLLRCVDGPSSSSYLLTLSDM